MFEIYILIGAIIHLNIYTHYQIHKDDVYFLDDEKVVYLLIVWLLPIIGALIAQYRLHADKTFYMTVMGLFFFFKYGIYYLMFEIF